MVLQYEDDLSRFHTIWLGESESNFLGCHIKPVMLTSEKHDSLRLKYKDSTSHSVLNIEGLSIKKIVNLNLFGLIWHTKHKPKSQTQYVN